MAYSETVCTVQVPVVKHSDRIAEKTRHSRGDVFEKVAR